MKKMTIASSLILATIAVGTLPVQAEEVANRDTDAIVKFKAPDEKRPQQQKSCSGSRRQRRQRSCDTYRPSKS